MNLFDSEYSELFSIDVESRRFTFASRAALRALGYSLEELMELQPGDVLEGLTPARFAWALDLLRAGKPYVAEVFARRKDASNFPVELRAELHAEEGREQIFAVATDITERKAAARQIDVLLSAINAAGDSILVFTAAPHAALRLAYANDAFYRQTGYTRDEAAGAALELFRKEMPDDPGMQSVRRAFALGEAVKTEVCSYRKDGTSFWNQITLQPVRNDAGELTHWISVERDVTEEVERESRLSEQNARLVRLGAAARELFGVLEMEVLIKHLEESVRDLTGARARVCGAADAETGSLSEDGRRARVVTANGFAVDVTAAKNATLRENDLLVVQLLAQYFGVAAQNVALVGEIEEQRNAVLELNQVKTDLIAMLAHDFKGPLTNILGYADLAGEIGDLNADQQEYLESIKRAALRLADLATDTLALSRLERNEIDLSGEDVDLAALLKTVAEAEDDQREIRLEVRGAAAVHGDARRLRQVFYNLLENAIKYSPGGQAVCVSIASQGGEAFVEVSDRGIGIPAKDLRRIFERFARGTNARKMRIPGTGFGLFLADQIVRMHGGHIEVESEEGTGSTFRVVLPLAGTGNLTRALRVAILERRSEARSFIAHALREAGFRARVAASLDAIGNGGYDVDRIVVDVDTTPLQVEHAQTLRALRNERNVGVVLVGAQPPEEAAGFAFIRKPYLMRDLLAAVQSGSTRSAPQ